MRRHDPTQPRIPAILLRAPSQRRALPEAFPADTASRVDTEGSRAAIAAVAATVAVVMAAVGTAS
jgi:hypothetical protein